MLKLEGFLFIIMDHFEVWTAGGFGSLELNLLKVLWKEKSGRWTGFTDVDKMTNPVMVRLNQPNPLWSSADSYH